MEIRHFLRIGTVFLNNTKSQSQRMFYSRCILAAVVAFALSYHGFMKNSLSISGAIAAFFVGFTSFAVSYRCGIILIVFYYSGSKFTKVREDVKARLEYNYTRGGRRNWIQVLSNSLLATLVAVVFFFVYGEDQYISFAKYPVMGQKYMSLMNGWILIPKYNFSAYLWALYVAHYAVAAGDTWASELGILSSVQPRLVTSFFTRTVPPGTNGGVSVLGTLASGLGGLMIGLTFYFLSYFAREQDLDSSQAPMIVFATLCGLLGSLFDSILGATLQVTYYDIERKCIVKTKAEIDVVNRDDIVVVTGRNVLSNEAVNFVSILMTMVTAMVLAPYVFCLLDDAQCGEAERINSWFERVFANIVLLLA